MVNNNESSRQSKNDFSHNTQSLAHLRMHYTHNAGLNEKPYNDREQHTDWDSSASKKKKKFYNLFKCKKKQW